MAIINKAVMQMALTAAGAIPRKDSLVRLVRHERTAPDGDEVPESLSVDLEEGDTVI